MRTCTPQEIDKHLTATPDSIQLLDVREPWEYELVHIKGSIHIPLGQLLQKINELNQEIPVAVLCHHGIRSAQACYYLEKSGFDTINISGGIDLWARELNPSMPLY